MIIERKIAKIWRKMMHPITRRQLRIRHCVGCGLAIFKEGHSNPDAQGRCIKVGGDVLWVKPGTPACNYWQEPKYRRKKK